MTSDFQRATWIKSRRSQQTTDACVEVAVLGAHIGVRDSKDPAAPNLIFDATTWAGFISQIKGGTHDGA